MIFKKRETTLAEGTSPFLKLKDGESITGLFRGELYEFYAKWDGNKNQLTNENDQEGKLRFRLNFVTKDSDGKLVAKIWEFGVMIYNQLADINEEYPLEETKVKISRKGVKTDTTYLILPLLKEPIDAKTKKTIESIPLNILEHKESVKQDEPF